MTKVNATRHEPKAERCLRSIWLLQLCYHGTKWQRWRLANPDGSMEEFVEFRQCKANATCFEIVHFLEQRDYAALKDITRRAQLHLWPRA